jgi:tetratricopeptide (TPR) repeat protein/TolB-like protein/predicted Ser/Thr protein kinase
MIGQTISHYKILEKLGEGGMGVVYKAEDTKLRRPVALKFLSPEVTYDDQAKRRFMQEAQAVSALDHPNIAVVHEIDETDDGSAFICMAYYDGQTLKDRLKSGAIPPDDAIRIALRTAEGLQRAHEAGIVHRDIKPANIIVTSRGEVKILDFGIAKLLGQAQHTTTARTAGTAAYMSPEQAQGLDIDARSDLFSLGVVLYEMVTGQRPFTGEHDAALLYSLLNIDPKPPSVLNPQIPKGLEAITLRLLEKDRSKRYKSTGDVVEELQHLLAEGTAGFPSERFGAPRGGKLFVPILTAIAAIVLTLVFVTSDTVHKLLWGPPLPQQRHLVVLPFHNITGDSSSQAFCNGIVEILTSKLNQLRAPGNDLWVVETNEVRRQNIASVAQAYQAFAVTLAVTGTIQREDNRTIVTLNLVDPKTSLLIVSDIIETRSEFLSTLMDRVIAIVTRMVEIQLNPEEQRTLTEDETSDSRAYELYVEGRGYLTRFERPENVSKAIILFRQAAERDSSYALAYAGLGEAFWRQYQNTKDILWVDSAISSCEKAIKLNDGLAPVYLTMGIIHRGRGRNEKAVQEFQRAIKLDPFSTDAYRELAIAYESLHDVKRAEAAYSRAIELKPSYWAGYNALGGFYYRYGKYNDAVAQFEKVVTYAPDNVRGWNNLGATYFKLEQWEAAKAALARSVQIEPNPVRYVNLGTLFFYLGQYQESAQAFEQATIMRPTDYRPWGDLASAYRWCPDSAKSHESFLKAASMAEEQLKVNPRDGQLLCDLAGYYAELREPKKALPLLRRAVALASTDMQLLGRSATVYEELGRRAQALRLLEKALQGGFLPTELQHDPEMKSLRADPRCKRLLARYLRTKPQH